MTDTDWSNVTLNAIKATFSDDSHVQLKIELGNAKVVDPERDMWFFLALRGYVGGVSSILNGAKPPHFGLARNGMMGMDVPRSRIEEAVKLIRAAVADFNVAYPALEAEWEQLADEKKAAKDALAARVAVDQAIIDQAMGEPDPQ